MSAYVRPGTGRWHVARWSAPGIYMVACGTLGWPAEVQAHYGAEWTYTINGQTVALDYDPAEPICRRCVQRVTSEARSVAALAERNEPPSRSGVE